MTLDYQPLHGKGFEELTLWLLRREGYEHVEHLGGGADQRGLDLRAVKDGRTYGVQCKNTRLPPGKARKAVKRVLAANDDLGLDCLLLVVSEQMTLPARDAVAELVVESELELRVWCGTELEERVRRHRSIVSHFFPHQVLLSDWPEPPWLTGPSRALRERALVREEEELASEVDLLDIRFGLLPPGRTTSARLVTPVYLALSPLRRREWQAVTGADPEEPDDADSYQGDLSVKDIIKFNDSARRKLGGIGGPWAFDFPTVGQWRYAEAVGRTSPHDDSPFGFRGFRDSVLQCCCSEEPGAPYLLLGDVGSRRRPLPDGRRAAPSRPLDWPTTSRESAVGFRPVLLRRTVAPARAPEVARQP
jgi:hypothetical protein